MGLMRKLPMLALGAAAMYFLDPEHGADRRRQARSRMPGAMRQARELANTAQTQGPSAVVSDAISRAQAAAKPRSRVVRADQPAPVPASALYTGGPAPELDPGATR